ncbi:helix-turn-helix domain-containing protein [Marmoricola sp. RAF53]|uniref:helix-turn-helix domain-containing protein n=1 Tax=Marmoricola sp. RAF53 TaxID=3233059 RepID=UPI003F9842AD
MSQPAPEICPTCHQGTANAPASAPLDDYLTPEDLASLLNDTVTTGTLRNWRYNRKGPRHVLIGRNPVYPRRAVHEWLEAQEQESVARWEDRA